MSQEETSASRRTDLRSSMFLGAVLRAGGRQAAANIRNMSPYGAMVETNMPLKVGSEVRLVRGVLGVQGTVMWASDGRCGLRFTSEISTRAWLAAPSLQQQRVDDMAAMVKSGAVTASYDDATSLRACRRPRSRRQLVEDLDLIRGLLLDMEDRFSSCPHMLAHHGVKLQSLDLAMQMLRAVTGEIEGAGGLPVIGASLEDLRAACAKALGTELGGQANHRWRTAGIPPRPSPWRTSETS